MVVSDEGLYRLYDLSNPASYTQHSLGSEVTELGVVSGKGYDDGFVVLTGGLQFMEVRGWKGGRVGAMAPSGMYPLTHETKDSQTNWQDLQNLLIHGQSSHLNNLPLAIPRYWFQQERR